MNIRKATLSDANAIACIIESTTELNALTSRGHEANVAIIQSNLERCESTGASTAYVIENREGKVAGYCAVHWTSFLILEGGEAYVTELFVDTTDRDEGLGSSLLRYVEDEARNRGCARLSLLNGKKSQAYERKFYAKQGWTEREIMANFILELDSDSEKNTK